MPTEEPQGLDEVLEHAISEIAAGKLPETHTEEAALHAPLKVERPEPLVIDPATEAMLWQHLGVGVPQPRRRNTGHR
jgi:hypothetical protein